MIKVVFERIQIYDRSSKEMVFRLTHERSQNHKLEDRIIAYLISIGIKLSISRIYSITLLASIRELEYL
jgi:hypothetical protein